MASVEWTQEAWAAHEAYAFGLYVEFGHDTMMDYLRLIDEAVSFIETHPLAGSPTISQMQGCIRCAWLFSSVTNQRQLPFIERLPAYGQPLYLVSVVGGRAGRHFNP